MQQTQKQIAPAVILIGAGRMGGALLKSWIASGSFRDILIVEPSPSEELKAIAARGAVVIAPATDVLSSAPDAVVLAVKPQVLKADPSLLTALTRWDTLVLSIAAGITTDYLARAGKRIVRAMPNTPGAIGRGITALLSSPSMSANDRALAEQLVTGLGKSVWVASEHLMDAVTAISGSGPAYVFYLVECLTSAGIKSGLDRHIAATLARETVSGAGALLDADSRPPAELRREVTSPGGTTEAALKVLMADGSLEALLLKAVDTAKKRGKELGSGS